MNEDKGDTVEEHRERRLLENERLIRSANFAIARYAEELLLNPAERERQELELFCACGRTDCDATLTISIGEYHRVHTQPNRFVVVPGHVNPDVERVVASSEGFVVVEKSRDL